MRYRIEFGEYIDWKSFRHLPKNDKERIQSMIGLKLKTEPTLYGKPLRSPLFGLWSLRVGDYRVIYRIMKDVVRIEAFGYRSTIYADAEKLQNF